MTQQAFLRAVHRILAEILDINVEDVRPTAILADDYNADSLDWVELTMELESEFDISIDCEEFEEWHHTEHGNGANPRDISETTVEDVIQFLRTKIKFDDEQ